MYIGLHVKYRYCCKILMKLQFSRQIFEKYANAKFHECPSSGSRVVPCGQTDRHAEANTRFSQFCERAPKNDSIDFLLYYSSVFHRVCVTCTSHATLAL